jgi:hypothetical protein
MRDSGATRALVLGLLALPVGLLAPFAILSAARSLRRIAASDGELGGAASAAIGLAAAVLALLTMVGGIAWWVLAS